ncbi:MAG: DUF4920 domain-containing protein [Flavobacteriales bacterium]|nr:DUF4920 domain-containing protein [Flavobacteriales bacterium]
MQRYLSYIVLALVMGCSANHDPDTILIEDGLNYYGKKIDDKKAVQLPEFDVLAGNTDTLYVKLKAGISDVSLEDGSWFRINLHNGKRMLVKFKDNAFQIPTDVSGKHVLIEGETYLDNLSEDIRKKLANDAGELQWIIDTVSGAQVHRIFIATSVVITE